jgi:hypothetical protein
MRMTFSSLPDVIRLVPLRPLLLAAMPGCGSDAAADTAVFSGGTVHR